jgi:polyhydroxyalkanoate synthesis regulator phasin
MDKNPDGTIGVTESINFHFANAEQQRRFHEVLDGRTFIRDTLKTAARIAELEAEIESLKDALQRAEEK